MKSIFTLCMLLCTILPAFAQTDTTATPAPPDDTIRIGGMVIIRKAGKERNESEKEYRIRTRKTSKPSNLSTNWWIFDLGFSNFSDKTNYSSVDAQAYAPGSDKSWFELREGKSRNVNIWFFMQRLNIAKHVLNLKYGLGVELNNYMYEDPIAYIKNTAPGPNPPRVTMFSSSTVEVKKNKLAADYLTVPMMLNINFTPNRKNGFGLSAGVSAGYLYSARNKTVSRDHSDEKEKTKSKVKDDFELETWKISYIAELSLGPVRFYGSYATKSMYERGLDMTPYNFGFRFSNW
jgi:hypothetical protein